MPIRTKPVRSAAAGPQLLDVPERRCLMIDGQGDPASSPRYQEAIRALYSIAYGIHFALKKQGGEVPHVGPLEGLWFVDGIEKLTFEENLARRHEWEWTLLIEVPEQADKHLVSAVMNDAERKHPELPVDRVRLAHFVEGRAAQLEHRGPYAEEKEDVEKLHAFIAEQGLHPRGRHHEIYLNDPRRVKPEKIRTLLRQPVA